MLNELINKINEQQKELKQDSPAFCVGEQLKDICSKSPKYVELVLQDLDQPQGNIKELAKKLQEYSDKHHKGAGCFCITPMIADKIIRNFYGLPDAEQIEIEAPAAPTHKRINLEDLI